MNKSYAYLPCNNNCNSEFVPQHFVPATSYTPVSMFLNFNSLGHFIVKKTTICNEESDWMKK